MQKQIRYILPLRGKILSSPTPKKIAEIYVKEHPEFSGLLMVYKLQPAGKGGCKTKSVTYQFVALAGRVARRRTCSDKSPCGHWFNSGPCQACLNVFLEPALRLAQMISRKGQAAEGWVCGKCLSEFSLPVVNEGAAGMTVELSPQ